MKRHILDILQGWKATGDRYPLIIRGARQVGKTWVVREHGRSYVSFVEINLDAEHEYLSIFKDHYGDPEKLIQALALVSGKKIIPGETLLFIDEIQESPEALLALRYLKEKKPQQHVIAAGSLIEFTLKEVSFPVGRIQFIHMFPLNFEEFLLAQNRDDLIQAIELANAESPLPMAVHLKLSELVALYCLLGGMPKVVATYADSGDLLLCQEHQQMLIANYRDDFSKYASKANIEAVRVLFQTVPRLIGKKFTYAHVDNTWRARDLSEALTLLEMAGVVYKTYHSSANGTPLGAQINPKKFKVFFVDVGLCQRLLGLNLAQLYIERKDLLANRGAVAEQFVFQELVSRTPKNRSPQLYYWHREEKSANAEIDLLTESGGSVIPIEVKSGSGGALKSLKRFLDEKSSYVKKSYVVTDKGFFSNGKIETIPHYAVKHIDF